MTKIINFIEEKEKIDSKGEMVPIEEWDGDCWKTMFDTLAEMFPDKDPWDNLANFIKSVFIK